MRDIVSGLCEKVYIRVARGGLVGGVQVLARGECVGEDVVEVGSKIDKSIVNGVECFIKIIKTDQKVIH